MNTPIRPVPSACLDLKPIGRRFHRALVAVCGLALLSVSVHARDYYFSTTTGTTGIPANDNNEGTMIEPMRSISKANELINSNGSNRVLFKRGEVWRDPPATNRLHLDGRSGAGPTTRITISAWGTGARPIITNLDKRPDGNAWQWDAASSSWKQAVSYAQAWRLYVNGVSKFNIETPWWDQTWIQEFLDKKQPVPPLPTAKNLGVDQWYIQATGSSSGIVYYKNGSSTVRPQNVEVQPRGLNPVLQIEDSDYVLVQGVDFRGGSQYAVVHIEAPCDEVVFDSNTIKQANHSGVRAGNFAGTAATGFVSNLDITNCVVDKTWTTNENDARLRLAGDGIALFHAVERATIRGNYVTNFGHVGIELTSYVRGLHGVKNCTVELNSVYASNSGYMHAFDMNGFEGLTRFNRIRRNFFHDYSATCHVQGDWNYVYSNVFTRVRKTLLPRHTGGQAFGVDMVPWKYTNPQTGEQTMMVAHHNLLAHNTFYDIDSYPIWVGRNSDNTTLVESNLIYNNLVVNYGYPHPTSLDVGLKVDTNAPGPTYVRSNNFWDGGWGANAGTVAAAQYPNRLNGSPGTAATVTAPGLSNIAPSYCSNNQQMNPYLAPPLNSLNANDFKLGSSAANFLKTGGVLVPADRRPPDAEWVDYNGDPWPTTSPGPSIASIGAIQFQ